MNLLLKRDFRLSHADGVEPEPDELLVLDAHLTAVVRNMLMCVYVSVSDSEGVCGEVWRAGQTVNTRTPTTTLQNEPTHSEQTE